MKLRMPSSREIWCRRRESLVCAWKSGVSRCHVSSLEKVAFRGIPGFLNVGEPQ